jgi:hypothetical protein
MIIQWKYIKGKIKLWREVVLSRLNLQSDFAGYDTLLEYVMRKELYKLDGDIAEIGAFMGGGTRKLATFFNNYAKRVIVVDVFDPSSDHTPNERGEPMSSIYHMILGRRDLFSLFKKNIIGLQNVVVHRIDSKKMEFDAGTKFCFSVIDGNHDPSYVISDFELLWARTVAGGVVALHDYGGDLPQVTAAIDGLLDNHKAQIEETDKNPSKCFIFIRKTGG